MPTFFVSDYDESGEIEFEVYCGTCGAGLCLNTKVKEPRRNERYLEIDVCEKCLAKACEESHSDGYDKGYNEAKDEAENS